MIYWNCSFIIKYILAKNLVKYYAGKWTEEEIDNFKIQNIMKVD